MAASRWLFTKQQILNTPSRKHGIDQDKELSYRQQAANLIQDMGQRLVVQLCINTAIVYMHRFYMFQSFKRFPRNDLAPACLFLAAKVEEQPRKLEHVIRVTHTCLHRDNTPPPDPKSEYYLESAHLLVVNENILLQTLGFDVSVDHPHTIVVKTTELVKASKDLAQTSYFLATNSLHLTTLCLQYRPATVACICIHLACKWSNWKIPLSSEGKEWHYYVDRTVSVDLLEEINLEFLDIMEKCPHKLRKKIMGWKAGNREALYEGDGRQSPMSAMRRLTPDSSSTDLRKPSQPPSHDPNRPGQSSSQHRSTNHDRKDGPQDQRSANPSQSDYRAGPDKKHVQSERKDEHLPERKEGLFERKDFLADKRLGHSQSHQERDANRHDRKEVPPDRKDRHPDRSDGNQHRKESYDRRDAQVRDQERKDLERKPDRKDYPVKKEVDEGRFHGNESRSQGREDRNLFQMVASDKLGGSQPASTATDLPRKAASDTALLPGYNSQHTPTSASSLSIKPKQEQTPLNYRDYLQRKERERKEKEKLMQSQADSNLNKTFTEGAKATERGDRSKHRPPNLNMSLPEDIVMGKSPGSQTSVIQRNRSFSGDRNQNNSVRQHNIVIKSPVKPHHNITVKSPIASSELRNFHIDVQKLTIPLTPDKPGSDPFTVNVKQHAAGQELMRNIKQEPGVTANIKQHSADHDLVKNIKQEPGISVNSKPASAGLELIKKIKQEPGISHSQPEKLDSVKVKIKSEPTTGLPETSNPVRTKSKSESTSSLPEKVDPVRSKSKLELVHSQPERTDTIKDKIEPTVAHSQLEKIDPVKIKIRSEQTDGAVESPTKPDTLDSASLAHLQKMKLKLKEELEMANSPKKTPKVPVLPEKDVAHVPVKRPSEAILDKTVSHIPPERTHKHSKHAPQTHSDRKKIPDIAVQKKIPEKVFPNMPNISVKTNQSFPKVRKIRTEPVLHTIPDEIPTKLKVETGLPIEDILKHKLKSDPGLPTMHNKPPSKMDDPSKQKAHVEPGTSRDNADRAGKHVVKHVANPDSNGSVIQLKPEHTGSEPLKLKIPELNVDAEKSPSLKFSIKTEPDTGSGGNTPIKVFLKRNTSQSGEKSPLKVKLSATGSKPDGEKIYEHGESSRPGSSHSHGKHKEKRKHKHRERHKEKHREHREKHHHSHATSELNGDKPGIKLSIKIPPQSSSSSELVPQRHSSKHEKHKRTSISDTALIKNQNSLEPERHQPWSANELAKRPRENSPARKRRRTPTVDQTSDASLQPSQNKAPKTETKGQRLRRSSSSHSVVSMEISDNETGSLAGCDILVPPNKADPQTEKKMEQIKLQLQQAIEQQSKKIQQVLQKQKSGFDLDSYMNASTSRPSLPSNLPPLPPTPPSSQTSIASPPPHPH